MRVPWTARRSNQSILKEINCEYSLKELMLKLRLQYFGYLIQRADTLEKIRMLGKIKGRGEGASRGWEGWMASSTQWTCCCCCSVPQSCPTLCDPMDCSMPGSLSSPSPRVCSNLCPLSQWCHPTISSSVVPFSSCLLSFTASGSFPVSQLFTSGDQSIGASASVSVLPMNIQGWFPLGLTGLISALQEPLKSLLQHHSSKASILRHSVFFIVQLLSPYMTIGKTIALTRQTFEGKVMSLL